MSRLTVRKVARALLRSWDRNALADNLEVDAVTAFGIAADLETEITRKGPSPERLAAYAEASEDANFLARLFDVVAEGD